MDQNNEVIPKSCDVVVIGGGPAGSSVAALLAKEGLHVVLLEKVKHPREQVGESTIPHLWKYTDLIGVSEKIEREGFVPKAGGIIVWDGRIQQVSFSSFGYGGRLPRHVERDRFDHILLQHAAECGVQVFEEVRALGVDLGNPQRPSVSFADLRGNSRSQGHISCKYVVDASGYSTVIAKQLRARKLVLSGHNRYLSLWGYYENAHYLGVDGKSHAPESLSQVKPVTFISAYQDGWVWHIILRNKTSVGLVMNTDRVKGMGKKAQENYFRETCARIRYLKDLLEPATFIEGSMRFRPDYSYYSEKVYGENFYCIGDAGTFVDPIFAQGVVTALYNATVCAWAITASLKNERRKPFYDKIFEDRVLQYYGFSRLLAHGDFGGEGIDPNLVRDLVNSMPQNELELTLIASATTNRADNFYQIARESGILNRLGEDFARDKVKFLDELDLTSCKSALSNARQPGLISG